MVDCQPEETLSTEAGPRSTVLFEGRRSTMSSRKECYIYFIEPNVPISYRTLNNIMLLNYFTHRATFSINVTLCSDVANNATSAAIGFSTRTVHAYISICRHFLHHVSFLWSDWSIKRATFFECHAVFTRAIVARVTFKKCRREWEWDWLLCMWR